MCLVPWQEEAGRAQRKTLNAQATPPSVYRELPLAETLVHSQLQRVGSCTVPFQGTRSLRACWVCPVPSLLIAQVEPPQLPASPTQEGSFPQTETRDEKSLRG